MAAPHPRLVVTNQGIPSEIKPETNIYKEQSCLEIATEFIANSHRTPRRPYFKKFENKQRDYKCSNNVLNNLAELISEEIISKGYVTARFIDLANFLGYEPPNVIRDIDSNINVCDVIILNETTSLNYIY